MWSAVEWGRETGRGGGDGGESGGGAPKLEDTHPSHRHNDGATGYGIDQKHSLKL